MKGITKLDRAVAAALGAMAILGVTGAAPAQVYWDVNGANAGASDTDSATGTWDAAAAFWTSDSTGVTGQAAYPGTPTAIVFSAGSTATGTSTITVSGAKTTTGITVEEGFVAVTGNAITNNASPVRINEGATFSIPAVGSVVTTPGSVVTLDGGTLRNSILGVGSTFWDADSTWELTSKGGTIDVPTTNSIMRFANNINLASGVTTATLTKIGVGEIRVKTGGHTALNVSQGLFRIDGSGPGLETGFGNVNNTVTVASGAAVGTTPAITSPATRSFSLSAGAAGATFVTNAPWTINGNIGGSGGLVLNGNGFPTTGVSGQALNLAGTNTYGGPTKINLASLTVSGGNAIPDGSAVSIDTAAAAAANFVVNASETIGSLAGGNATFGIVNLSAGTLTTGGDNTSATYAGQLVGGGDLTKVGTGTMTLTGASTHSGTTTVNAGTLKAQSTGSLPGHLTAGKVVANSGGTVAVKAGAVGQWTAPDIDLLMTNATFAAGSSLGIDTTDGAFTYGSGLSGAQGLKKLGLNALTLTGANSYAGGTEVTLGTLVLGNADATAGGAINVANGAVAQAQASLPKAVTVSTLNTNTSGKFDLTNNSMVVKGMSDTQVKAEIVKAYNAGAWNGAGGLTSSTAAAATIGTTGIGYALNSDLGTLTSFKGVTPLSGTDVLVKYTYFGDADLDGDVDGNDVGNWAGNFTGSGGSTTKTWFQGDWDYDGDVDGNDVGLWAGNFTGSGGGVLSLPNAQPGAIAALEAMGFTVVPEPTGLALLGVAGAGLLARRRRRD